MNRAAMMRWIMSRWDFVQLRKEQESLARLVRLGDGKKLSEIRTIAGADLTFLNPWKTPTEGIACIVRMRFPEMEVLETTVARARVTFPYVPGFLAYRELPLLMKTYRKMREKADVFLIDGQGIAHPRRFGIAAHFGVVTGEMAIGCAKSWLCGEFREPRRRGVSASLREKSGKVIGRVLRPKDGKSLLFVSPGHRVSVGTSLKIVKLCLKGYKIPEPTRLAHNHLQEVRRSLISGQALR